MSGHMFFGGDYLGLRRRAVRRGAAARDREPAGRSASRRCSPTCPRTTATPEIRVDVPEDEKFAHGRARPRRTSPRAIPVNTIDGVRITFPDGWGLLRASNTQPILVLRFEASDPRSLDAARSEVVGWLAGQGVRA